MTDADRGGAASSEHGLDPELGSLVSLLPALDFADVAAARAMLAGAAAVVGSPDPAPDFSVSDRRIPGPPGAPDVPVRIYRPRGDGTRPALVYFHGGAFVLGQVELFDAMCGAYAANADLIVVSVDYRLAPEHPFPAAVDDCYAALEWTAANAADLAIDPAAVAVGGLSAGGALAAAVALMARDRDGPAIAFQLLVNAVLDDRLDTVSAQAFPDTPLWNSHDAAVMWDLYLGPERRHVSPYAAPARATDLCGLPPAYVLTSEFDPLRDEGIAYALRMLQAGVSVELHNVVGAFHGFDVFPTAISRAAAAEQQAALRRALHKS
jgi:acetyl esterase/lipase